MKRQCQETGAMAQELGVSEKEIIRCLPGDMVKEVSKDRFDEIIAEVSGWGIVTVIVQNESTILKVKAPFPVGTYGHGYYNLKSKDSPIGGNIKVDDLSAIFKNRLEEENNKMNKNILLTIILMAAMIFIAAVAQADEKITIVDDAKRKVEIPVKPKRIVVLNSSNLELLYAVGGRAIGRPEITGMPAYLVKKVKNLPSIGETPNPNVEKIVSLNPDLVIGINVMFHHAIIPAMDKAGIPILLLSINSYQDILDKIRFFGKITGNTKRAEELIRNIEKKVSDIKKRIQGHTPPRVVIIWGSTQSFNMALPNSFVGNLVEMLGGINIAAQSKALPSMPQYAPLSLEYILAKDPDMVFLITHGNDKKVSDKFKKEIQGHPAWNGMRAVKEGKVYTLPYSLFGVNPTIRVPEAIEYLAKLMYPKAFKK